MNGVIIFVEGAHDLAFLGRILMLSGYQNLSSNVGYRDLPAPLNGIIEMELKKHPFYTDVFAKPPKLPFIYHKHDGYVLIYNCGGDGQSQFIKDTKDGFELALALPSALDQKNGFISSFEYVFFYDADDHGVEGRLTIVIEKLSGCFTEEYIRENCYVFVDAATDKGNLETLLKDLINRSSPKAYQVVDNLIQNSGLTFESPDKALINIVGQQVCSGCSNTVIVKDRDGVVIKDDILRSSTHFNSICQFFAKPSISIV